MTAQDAQNADAAATGRLALKSKLDLKGSDDLAKELQELRGSDLTIDPSAVEQLGAHAVQTLIVAARSWAADGNAFTVEALPAGAAAHLATLGMDQTIFDVERTE